MHQRQLRRRPATALPQPHAGGMQAHRDLPAGRLRAWLAAGCIVCGCTCIFKSPAAAASFASTVSFCTHRDGESC
eukprot:CAMPEP_0175405570 /NCGR_PEP_ID=MMETSP0095-20121207/39120_1 /TAXON_ID=311494 /ORGANISM="Alexandrium monilatum, Strain CCMP3105" /LENGTH=74 /DNA_ID=CAMNT_0016704411 /DNA_START=1 /DNA_END=222 /DNA_ORIENTATION=-